MRGAPLLLLAVLIGCAKSDATAPAPEPAPAALSDFAKQVLLTLDELKVQPGAAAFMKDLDGDASLTEALAKGLDADAKRRFQKLVDKHRKSDIFRAAVIAAGGDPAACAPPSPDDKDPEADCEKKSLNLLDP